MSTATITEDEAALYDRQIRLWGLEAQQKMRNATVLVVRLRGLATETIKNIVLSGIGKLIVLDDALVQPEDVGAGFFFREEDINKKTRVDAAKPHIQSLNPLVEVQVLHEMTILRSEEQLDSLLKDVDVVCLTDMDQAQAIRVNDVARRLGKRFYCAGSFGLSGYIFCDLLEHQHVATARVPPKDGSPAKLEHYTTLYSPLSKALQHSWKDTTSNASKALRPHSVFSILAAWEYQTQHGSPPGSTSSVDELQAEANRLLKRAQVRAKVCTSIDRELIEFMAQTAATEFTPTCAIVGGMLGQDILKTLAGREAPLANFFFFDGQSCNGSVVRMSMQPLYEGPPPSVNTSTDKPVETVFVDLDD